MAHSVDLQQHPPKEREENATRTQNPRRTTSLHPLQRNTRPTSRRVTQMIYKCQECGFATAFHATITLHVRLSHKNYPTITAKE